MASDREAALPERTYFASATRNKASKTWYLPHISKKRLPFRSWKTTCVWL